MAKSSIADQCRDQAGRGARVSRALGGVAFYQEHGEGFRSLGDGRYEVPSRSRSGKRHEVNIDHEACSCEDYTRRNPYNTPPDEIRPCAHIYAIVIAISKPARIPSRERVRFTGEQVMANVEAMGA